MLQQGANLRLEFVFDGEDGSADAEKNALDLLQEPFGETRTGEFVLGGEDESLHGVLGKSGRLWTNGRDNFETTSAVSDGRWTYTVDIPLSCIPRATGDENAFFANFFRKSRSGQYQWVGNPVVTPKRARGGCLVRLAPERDVQTCFVNEMDCPQNFKTCWEKDAPCIAFEPSGGYSGGCFHLRNTNATEAVCFHNGTVPGFSGGFVALPSVSMPVVSEVRVKGKGRFRFGFMPWTVDRHVLFPAERTVREYAVDSPDKWVVIRDGYIPRPDRLYAERAACVLPSFWLEPGGDVLIDALRVMVYRAVCSDDAELEALPAGNDQGVIPSVARTPTMRGPFVAKEWRTARAAGGVRYLADARMLYVAAETHDRPLVLDLRTPEGAPLRISVTPEGVATVPGGQPVHTFVNRGPDGRLVCRLAVPLWLGRAVGLESACCRRRR